MKPPRFALAVLALSLAAATVTLPVASATTCVILRGPDMPPAVVGECTVTESEAGGPPRIVIWMDGQCVSVEQVGTIPPVALYDCDVVVPP